jgi:hypothetical protein
VSDQYSPAEEWREQASYFEAPGANQYDELHRESGSAARALPVETSGSKKRSSSVGAPIRLLTAPGIKAPGGNGPQVGQIAYDKYSLDFADRKNRAILEVVESAQYAFASRPGKIPAERNSGNRRTVHFLLEGPQTINDGEWAAVHLDHEPKPAGRETGACPFRARFRKVSIRL